MRVVVALGGNALLRRDQPPDEAVQRENVRVAAEALASVAADHELVVTHGNGPQVGLLALQAAAVEGVSLYHLDVLNAETEGMIGYLLESELANHLPHASIATLLTMVEVDRADTALANPTKPVGAIYDEAEARRLADEHSWTIAPDGRGWRRVVPSPLPIRIVELDAIQHLVSTGTIVICAGGGGIPVARTEGRFVGVEAVVDKDAASSLLARDINADCLVLATDVTHVERNWGSPDACPITRATPDELAGLRFATGSMAPKVDAACEFVNASDGRAVIGSLADIPDMVAGHAGTQISD